MKTDIQHQETRAPMSGRPELRRWVQFGSVVVAYGVFSWAVWLSLPRPTFTLFQTVVAGSVIVAVASAGHRIGFDRRMAWAVTFPFTGLLLGPLAVWRFCSLHDPYWEGTTYPDRVGFLWSVAIVLGGLSLVGAVLTLPGTIREGWPQESRLHGEVFHPDQTLDDLLEASSHGQRRGDEMVLVVPQRLEGRPSAFDAEVRAIRVVRLRRTSWWLGERWSVEQVQDVGRADPEGGSFPGVPVDVWVFEVPGWEGSRTLPEGLDRPRFVRATFENGVFTSSVEEGVAAIFEGEGALISWRAIDADGDVVVDFPPPPFQRSAIPDGAPAPPSRFSAPGT